MDLTVPQCLPVLTCHQTGLVSGETGKTAVVTVGADTGEARSAFPKPFRAALKILRLTRP